MSMKSVLVNSIIAALMGILMGGGLALIGFTPVPVDHMSHVIDNVITAAFSGFMGAFFPLFMLRKKLGKGA